MAKNKQKSHSSSSNVEIVACPVKKKITNPHILSLITQILFAVLVSSVRASPTFSSASVVNHSLLTCDYLFLECRVFFSKIFKSTFLSRLCIEKYFLNLFLMGDFVVVVVVVGGVVVVSSVLRLIFLCFIECVCVSV